MALEVLKRNKCKVLCKDAGLSCPPCPEGVKVDSARDADTFYNTAKKLGLTPRRFYMAGGTVVIWRGANPTQGARPENLPFGEGA